MHSRMMDQGQDQARAWWQPRKLVSWSLKASRSVAPARSLGLVCMVGRKQRLLGWS